MITNLSKIIDMYVRTISGKGEVTNKSLINIWFGPTSRYYNATWTTVNQRIRVQSSQKWHDDKARASN